jgi:hypothetical protein
MLDDSNGHIVLATGGDTSLLTDILQPESPIACDGDTSLLVSQRAKHKEQQMQCRQQAASLMLGLANNSNAVSKLLQLGASGNQSTIPILHQQQQQPTVLFQHHQQQQPITAAPMSVTYGFMKNSRFGSNSTVAVNQPTLAVNSNQTVMPGHVQQPQLSSQPAPKFLATNPSMMMMMSHHLNHHHNQPHQTHHHQQTSLRGTAINTSKI